MKWNWQEWSNLVWIALTVIVVTFELLGVFRVGPWRTLSETIWLDEDRFKLLYVLVGGFLCGLGLHFCPNKINFWKSMLVGFLISLATYLVATFWPN